MLGAPRPEARPETLGARFWVDQETTSSGPECPALSSRGELGKDPGQSQDCPRPRRQVRDADGGLSSQRHLLGRSGLSGVTRGEGAGPGRAGRRLRGSGTAGRALTALASGAAHRPQPSPPAVPSSRTRRALRPRGPAALNQAGSGRPGGQSKAELAVGGAGRPRFSPFTLLRGGRSRPHQKTARARCRQAPRLQLRQLPAQHHEGGRRLRQPVSFGQNPRFPGRAVSPRTSPLRPLAAQRALPARTRLPPSPHGGDTFGPGARHRFV